MPETKSTLPEMKDAFGGPTDRPNPVKEGISELEERWIGMPQSEGRGGKK
jgi:hypothetical protein